MCGEPSGNQFSEKFSNPELLIAPSSYRTGKDRLAYLYSACGANGLARGAEIHTTIVPGKSTKGYQTPRLTLDIFHDVLVSDMEDCLFRQYRAPVIHQVLVAAIVTTQLPQLIAEMLS